MLSFLNTGILLVAIASVVPLLIHLFIKNKPQQVLFSSLKFLREVIHEQRKKMTITQIVLLILRMLVILFIVFALARPVLQLPFLNKGNYHPPTAVAFILDTSASMDYVVNQKTQLQHGLDIIRNIQSEMTPADASILFTSDHLHNTMRSQLYFGLLPEKDLSDIDFTWTPEPLDKLIALAEEELDKSRFLHKEIYVVSDMNFQMPTHSPISQDSEYETDVTPVNVEAVADTSPPLPIVPINLEGANITYISTFTDSIRINLAVEKVSIKRELISGTLQRIAEFEVVNHSPLSQRDQVVRLNLNGVVVAEKMLDFSPNERKSDFLVITNEHIQWNTGFVEVRNERFLPDNRYYFAFYSDPSPTIGIVTTIGDIPRPLEVLADIFIGTNGKQEYLSIENFQIADRNKYHFLIFYVNTFNSRIQTLIQELRKQDYKSMFIIPQSITEDSKRFLEREYAMEIGNTQNTMPRGASPITSFHQWHSIVGNFQFSTNVPLFVKPAVEISATRGNIPLVSTASTPIIIENKDIFINIDFATPQNFLSHPAFPVIVYRSFSWISRYDGILNYFEIGQPFTQRQGILKSPSGVEYDAQNTRFRFTEPGIWQFTDQNAEITYIAVNMADFENQSRHYTTDKSQYLTDNYMLKVLQTDRGSEIWKTLLWAVMVFLVTEMTIVMILQRKAKSA